MVLITPFNRVWKNKQPLMMYLWVCFVAVFIFLTIDQGKRQHYILPIMPVMAMMIGILLEDMIFIQQIAPAEFAFKTLLYHAIIIGGGTVIGAGIVVSKISAFGFRTFILSVCVIFFISIVLLLFRRQKRSYAGCLIFIGIISINLLARGFFMKDFDKDIYTQHFAVEAAKRVPATVTLSAYQNVSRRFVQYYGKIVPVIKDENEVQGVYEKGGWIYCDLEFIEKFKTLEASNLFSVVYSKTTIPRQVLKSDYGGVLFQGADTSKTK
jgi:4-amino-4-deoxy-L-arabinose transferase-like glycosyltransferase